MPLNTDDDSAEAKLELGITLARAARWRDAIEPLQRAIALDPALAAAHYQLGEAYNHTDQLNEALGAFEAAAALQPDHWRAFQGMGVALDRLGRPEDARLAYQRAREANRR